MGGGKPSVAVNGNGTYAHFIDYALAVECKRDELGPVVSIREDWPDQSITQDFLIETPVYYEIDGEPGTTQDWVFSMESARSAVWHIPPFDVMDRIVATLLSGEAHELYVLFNPEKKDQVVEMTFNVSGFRDVAAPVLEHCGSPEQLARVRQPG